MILKAPSPLGRKENRHGFRNFMWFWRILLAIFCKLGLVTLEPGLKQEGLAARPHSALLCRCAGRADGCPDCETGTGWSC